VQARHRPTSKPEKPKRTECVYGMPEILPEPGQRGERKQGADDVQPPGPATEPLAPANRSERWDRLRRPQSLRAGAVAR